MTENIKMLWHGSLFTGIGGFDLGFEGAGIRTLWTVENDKSCNQVLATHWPNVERYKDVRECGKHDLQPVDVISGGFPCQDLSVAGRREGLAGERSGLWFEFARIVQEMEAKWVVVENVPGLLSSAQGTDFATIVGMLEQFGYCVSWRVLDSQFFGVPQRRRRVFIVGSLGGMGSIQMLFESEGSEGHPAKGKEEGKRLATDVAASLRGRSWKGPDTEDGLVTISHALTACKTATGRLGPNEQTFIIENRSALTPWDGARARIISEDGTAPTLTGRDVGSQQPAYVAFDWQSGGDVRLNVSDKHTSALSQGQTPAVCGVGVRRFTPTECERLQGFPDGWTEGLSDSARYRCLGNAVTVNVTEWLGKRLAEYDREHKGEGK